MKKTLFLFVAAIILAACNSNAPKKEQATSEAQVYTVTELLESASDLVSETITLKGVVVHVCKHGGQKMFLTSDDKEHKIKINISSNLTEFDVALEGSLVEVTGTVIAEAVEIHEEEELENAEDNEVENQKENDTDSEESIEDDCEFEKNTIIYEIKAQSYKEISE